MTVLSARARTRLDEFLKLNAAEAGGDLRLRMFIREWALDPGYGALPDPSGRSFANWIDGCWADWSEDEEITVKQVLEGAVTDWCGGRVMPS